MAFPLLVPLIAAGAGAAGAVGGALINSGAQKEANEKNIALAREQMEFQRTMANTAYQRGMADMRKAGLNPMLAFSQGGASSPQGSLARVESTRPGDALSSGVSSATQTLSAAADAAQKQSNVELQATQQLATIADAQLKESSAKQVQANTSNALVEGKILRAKLPKVKVEAELEKQHAEYDKENAKYDNMRKRIDETLGTVGTAIDAINPLRWLRKSPTRPNNPGGSKPPANHRDYYKNIGGGQWKRK